MVLGLTIVYSLVNWGLNLGLLCCNFLLFLLFVIFLLILAFIPYTMGWEDRKEQQNIKDVSQAKRPFWSKARNVRELSYIFKKLPIIHFHVSKKHINQVIKAIANSPYFYIPYKSQFHLSKKMFPKFSLEFQGVKKTYILQK